MSESSGKQEQCQLTECEVEIPKGSESFDLITVLVECRVKCASGVDKRAADCLTCPRLAGIVRSDDGYGVRVRCWWRGEAKPKRLARGSQTFEVLDFAEPCSACSSIEGVVAHPEMTDVYFCRSCMEQIEEPVDWAELGTGD